jgi:hypothetical protein
MQVKHVHFGTQMVACIPVAANVRESADVLFAGLHMRVDKFRQRLLKINDLWTSSIVEVKNKIKAVSVTGRGGL